MRVRTTLPAAAVALLAMASRADADATARQLPAPTGATQAAAIGMSATGLVHGAVTTDSGTHAVTWRGGRRTDLEPTSAYSLAYEGNDFDQVVGHRDVGGVRHAVLWSGGRSVDLAPRGAVDSAALDVNNRGEVLVTSTDAAENRRLSVWRAGTWRTVSTGPYASTGALGERGDVAYAVEGNAFVVAPGRPAVAIGAGTPVDVNASGQVLLAAQSKLLLWSRGTTTDIGSLGGGQSYVSASQEGSGPWLNDSGQVVGQSTTADGHTHAFSWKAGVITDLTPGPVSGAAFAVNRAGVVTVSTFAPTPKLALWKQGRFTALPLPTGGIPIASALHPTLPWAGGTILSSDTTTSAAYEWR